MDCDEYPMSAPLPTKTSKNTVKLSEIQIKKSKNKKVEEKMEKN